MVPGLLHVLVARPPAGRDPPPRRRQATCEFKSATDFRALLDLDNGLIGGSRTALIAMDRRVLAALGAGVVAGGF